MILGVRKWVRCICCWQSPAFFFSVVTKIDFFTLSLRLLRLIRKAMPSSMKPFQMLVEISAIQVSSLSPEYFFSNNFSKLFGRTLWSIHYHNHSRDLDLDLSNSKQTNGGAYCTIRTIRFAYQMPKCISCPIAFTPFTPLEFSLNGTRI